MRAVSRDAEPRHFLGFGILVNSSGISRTLQAEGLGWVLYGFASHVQQGTVDGEPHARPRDRT